MICKLDFDSDREYRHFRRVRLPWVTRAMARTRWIVRVERVRRSSSCRGFHVWVGITELCPSVDQLRGLPSRVPTDLAFQLLLGSDWKREGLYLRRCLEGTPTPMFWRRRSNILYTTKLKRGKRQARRAKARA